GEAALAAAGEADAALREALELATILRAIDPQAEAVQGFLARVDLAERVSASNQAGEQALAAGDLGETGGGALAAFREALELVPGPPRAPQGPAETGRDAPWRQVQP